MNKYKYTKLAFTLLPLLWVAMFAFMWQESPQPFDWRVAAGAFLLGWFMKG